MLTIWSDRLFVLMPRALALSWPSGILACCITAFFTASGAASDRSAPPSIEQTLVDDAAIAYATFQSHNQKVVSNRKGIFITYLHSANENYTAQEWRLCRSTDGGKTFSVVYRATDVTNAPAMETDAEGNLYLFRGDWSNGTAVLYRFMAADDYRKPAIFKYNISLAGGKHCMAIDAKRGQLYFAQNASQFLVVGLDGKQRQLTTLWDAGGKAHLEYPHLALAQNGDLHAAWTTAKGDVYWDIHAMRSRDGGKKWQKLDGTRLDPPIAADNTGPTDRLTLEDEFDRNSWLSTMLVKSGKLHFVYWTENKPHRQHYVRYDIANGKKEIDLSPMFPEKTVKTRSDSGFFGTDGGRPGSRLYFVTAIDERKRLACIVSKDDGKTWEKHASGQQKFEHRVYSIGGACQITADGYIIGTFTDVVPGSKSYYEPRSGKVYFFRIKVAN